MANYIMDVEKQACGATALKHSNWCTPSSLHDYSKCVSPVLRSDVQLLHWSDIENQYTPICFQHLSDYEWRSTEEIT